MNERKPMILVFGIYILMIQEILLVSRLIKLVDARELMVIETSHL
jgi:hypothetical protein